MGAQTSAILKGFDYQHLISWYRILFLKSKDEVIKIKLENSEAGYVDDLTVYKKDGSVEFYQIKYHVNSGSYSFDSLLHANEGNSLMEKFWVTWKKLSAKFPKDKIKLILFSNWSSEPGDDVLTCSSGEDGALDQKFYVASPGSSCGKKREEWKKKHSATDAEFIDFTKSLSFLLGMNVTAQWKEIIADKMELVGLKRDDTSLTMGVNIVKDWIKTKTEEITVELLEKEIKEHDLSAPGDSEKAAVVYLATVKDGKFDLSPDYVLDWRKYFRQLPGKRDHELINPKDWNEKMLPELLGLETRINTERTVNIIRSRGYARLSTWFAFGHAFSEVSGYAIEVSQQYKLWRSDFKPSQDFILESENGEGEVFSNSTNSVAVGISLTGSLSADVRKYLLENEKIDSLLLLKPVNGANPDSIKDNSDAVAFAIQAKELIRSFVKKHRAQKLLLFYFGPLSGACFLGHRLNAICKEVQIMENTSDGSYVNSFLLT